MSGASLTAARQARTAGCEWLHVDFEDHLRPFYFGSADSGQQMPGSSPCKRNNSGEMRPADIRSCLPVRALRVSAAATAGTAGASALATRTISDTFCDIFCAI